MSAKTPCGMSGMALGFHAPCPWRNAGPRTLDERHAVRRALLDAGELEGDGANVVVGHWKSSTATRVPARFARDDVPPSRTRNSSTDLLEQPRRVRIDHLDLDRAEECRTGDAHGRRAGGRRRGRLALDLGAPQHGVDLTFDAEIGRHANLDARHDTAD